MISMKCVWYNSFGKAREVLVYGEQEITEPGYMEVRVRLFASAVNPSDVKKRSGASPALLAQGFVIPNSDGAGIIDAIGEGVEAQRMGERVWVYNGQHGRRMGTAAEYITLPQEQAVLLPGEADFQTGACMGIPAMTAHRCVMADEPIQDRLVLVTGGAGRVGYYAIQWAKLYGAKVIATAGSALSRKHCEDAGADFVTGHPSQADCRAILEYTGGRKVDRIVDGNFGANLPFLLDIIGKNGVIASYASSTVTEPVFPFYRMMYLDVTLRTVIVYDMPWQAKQRAIEDITRMLGNNALKHRVAQIYPLSETILAHEAIERSDQHGCVVLEIARA
jgi:NADPH2:quinone reductase